jgi:1,4-alpha-glucan branching enzyme
MPQASSVELAGSFTGWNRIGMKKISDSGYWQINIPLEKGEYAYIFIVDGKTQIADPTVKAKQVDDFGGENSIINIGNEI